MRRRKQVFFWLKFKSLLNFSFSWTPYSILWSKTDCFWKTKLTFYIWLQPSEQAPVLNIFFSFFSHHQQQNWHSSGLLSLGNVDLSKHQEAAIKSFHLLHTSFKTNSLVCEPVLKSEIKLPFYVSNSNSLLHIWP